MKNHNNLFFSSHINIDMKLNLSYEIKRILASNPNTPKEILEELANEDNYEINLLVASNPNTPINIIERFAFYSPVLSINCAAASNHSISKEIALRLVELDSISINHELAKNPASPVEILGQFAKTAFEQFYKKEDYEVDEFGEIASNPSLPVEFLIELSKNTFSNIHHILVANPSLPIELLEKFSKNKFSHLHSFIASNPNLSEKTFINLAKSKDISVIFSLTENNNTPSFILEQIAIDAFENYEKNEDYYYVLLRIAKNSNSPLNIINILSSGIIPGMSIELAKNPKIPYSLIQSFLNSDDKKVFLAAINNPLYFSKFISDLMSIRSKIEDLKKETIEKTLQLLEIKSEILH